MLILFIDVNVAFLMQYVKVPFGDVTCVREWLGIVGAVSKPVNEHPKRPVEGFHCSRSEVSGTRFWNLIKTLSSSDPSTFFKTCYVHNYCPLSFMSVTGKNVTPPMFKVSVRRQFHSACDWSLVQMIELLHVEVVIAVGKYVEGRTREALKDFTKWDVRVFSIMHPSPINPAANKGNWQQLVIEQLKEMNVFNIIVGNAVDGQLARDQQAKS